MQNKIQLLSSGIPLVDKEWGGLYCGGSYFLIGSHKSGRTLLSLQYAMESVKQNEVCLFFTSIRPKDLLIQASCIDFDLQDSLEKNQVILVKTVPPSYTDIIYNSDEFLVEYLKDIVALVKQYQPSKIVFDELTPFIEFDDFNLLQNVFSESREKIENEGITSLYILGEPATSSAQSIVDSIVSKSTGVIYLKKENEEGRFGEMIITPNIGHNEGQFRSIYKIEPYKGLVIHAKHEGPSLGSLRNRDVA